MSLKNLRDLVRVALLLVLVFAAAATYAWACFIWLKDGGGPAWPVVLSYLAVAALLLVHQKLFPIASRRGFADSVLLSLVWLPLALLTPVIVVSAVVAYGLAMLPARLWSRSRLGQYLERWWAGR